jgi:hypothetical protein
MRPSGMAASMRARPPPAIGAATISVSIQPGATQLTVIPRGASSTATLLTSEIIAPLLAA